MNWVWNQYLMCILYNLRDFTRATRKWTLLTFAEVRTEISSLCTPLQLFHTHTRQFGFYSFCGVGPLCAHVWGGTMYREEDLYEEEGREHTCPYQDARVTVKRMATPHCPPSMPPWFTSSSQNSLRRVKMQEEGGVERLVGGAAVGWLKWDAAVPTRKGNFPRALNAYPRASCSLTLCRVISLSQKSPFDCIVALFKVFPEVPASQTGGKSS